MKNNSRIDVIKLEESDMIISERIFKILNDKQMSQNAFAKKMGLSGSTISDWKTKKTNPSAEKIIPICEALEVTPEQLLTGKGIDNDFEDNTEQKSSNNFIISDSDIRILEVYHGLRDEQRKRLLKYMEALRQLEELEDLSGI